MKRLNEKGQALAEAAVFSLLAVLLGFALLALIPVHRTRTAATAAAFACTQFVSQAANRKEAVRQAEEIGRRTIRQNWSGTRGSVFIVRAWHNGHPGKDSGCSVQFKSPVMFSGLLGFSDPGEGRVSFTARIETWKARWP